MKLKIRKLHEDAVVPVYAHPGDAGMDLYALEDCLVAPLKRAAVRTGLSFEIPEGYVGLIWDKSGLALNKGAKTMGGVIDAGYRGEVQVVVANLGEGPLEIRKGTKVAQMLIQPVAAAAIEVVEELSDTARGSGGFGSTGV